MMTWLWANQTFRSCKKCNWSTKKDIGYIKTSVKKYDFLLGRMCYAGNDGYQNLFSFCTSVSFVTHWITIKGFVTGCQLTLPENIKPFWF